MDPISWTRGISMSIVMMQPPPAAARRPAPNPPGPRPHPSGLADPVMRSQRAQTRQNSVTLSRRQGEQMNDSHIFLLASVYQSAKDKPKDNQDGATDSAALGLWHSAFSGKARVPVRLRNVINGTSVGGEVYSIAIALMQFNFALLLYGLYYTEIYYR